MRCPFCGSAETKVIDSRFNEDSFSVKRRRECMTCGARFNTLETSDLSYPRVIKTDDSTEVFNESKVRRGVNRAFEKRKITTDQIDELIQKVLTRCSQYPSKEMPSSAIGQAIMNEIILLGYQEIDLLKYTFPLNRRPSIITSLIVFSLTFFI
mgnify:CR=1 FL=1